MVFFPFFVLVVLLSVSCPCWVVLLGLLLVVVLPSSPSYRCCCGAPSLVTHSLSVMAAGSSCQTRLRCSNVLHKGGKVGYGVVSCLSVSPQGRFQTEHYSTKHQHAAHTPTRTLNTHTHTPTRVLDTPQHTQQTTRCTYHKTKKQTHSFLNEHTETHHFWEPWHPLVTAISRR